MRSNMDGEGAKRVRSRTGEVDRMTSLPDCLLFQILSNLRTKDVVKTSVLSSRWRNIFRYVPRLDLDGRDFGNDYTALVFFSDRFLCVNNREFCLQEFSLMYDWNEHGYPSFAQFQRWINTAADRRVRHLHISCKSIAFFHEVQIPLSVYTCESLVSLDLDKLALPDPKSVTLPCVKVIKLSVVLFASNLAFEMLVSGCPLLESLTVSAITLLEKVKVLRVYSQSLLSFSLTGYNCVDKDIAVVIDAPKLEYLQLSNYAAESFTLKNLVSLVTVDMYIKFKNPNDPSKRIHSFLFQIATAKNMFISGETLKAFYSYMRCQKPLPLFCNLSYMYATVVTWKMLPTFLKSCPNLKSLVLHDQEYDKICDVPRLGCFLASLEYVEIKWAFTWDASAMKPVSYFLENASRLKKLTLRLSSYHSERKEDSVILEELCAIPRLSTSCQIEIISAPLHTFLHR